MIRLLQYYRRYNIGRFFSKLNNPHIIRFLEAFEGLHEIIIGNLYLTSPHSYSCRSPRVKKFVSYESLEKFMSIALPDFCVSVRSAIFAPKIKNRLKWWHLSIHYPISTFNTALEASCPQEFKSSDCLRISQELRIL